MASSCELASFDRLVLLLNGYRPMLITVQSQSGIFQLLPLGVRVQDKIANLLDKHMQTLSMPPAPGQLLLD